MGDFIQRIFLFASTTLFCVVFESTVNFPTDFFSKTFDFQELFWCGGRILKKFLKTKKNIQFQIIRRKVVNQSINQRRNTGGTPTLQPQFTELCRPTPIRFASPTTKAFFPPFRIKMTKKRKIIKKCRRFNSNLFNFFGFSVFSTKNVQEFEKWVLLFFFIGCVKRKRRSALSRVWPNRTDWLGVFSYACTDTYQNDNPCEASTCLTWEMHCDFFCLLHGYKARGSGVSHRFREGATCMSAAQSLIRGALFKPVAPSASRALYDILKKCSRCRQTA